jgi:hypothetical protein
MLQHTVLNNKKQIFSNWLQDNVINLTDSTFQIPDTYSYEILEVTEKYIARPDLLSNDIYGDTLYGDLICKLNGISNPFELNKGMILVIPSPDNIMDFMKEISIEDSDIVSNVNDKPIVKQKHEKRKANEAVLGDTRFRIDKTRGVVIY